MKHFVPVLMMVLGFTLGQVLPSRAAIESGHHPVENQKEALSGTTALTQANLRLDMLDDKIKRLDDEMLSMQQKVEALPMTKGIESHELPPLERHQAQPVVQGKISQEGINELYTQLEMQNNVIEGLTQKTEELSFALSKLQEKVDLMNADIDVRFQNLSQSTHAKHKVPKVPPKKPTTQQIENADKEAYEQAYEHAYGLLKTRKYAEAEQALSQFIQDYPDSKLAGNANYWLGETFYVRGQYAVAAGIFSDGLTKYEKNTKAPDNLLKLGMTMGHLGKKKEACGFLTLLPQKFPKASSVLKSRAKAEAKKLACPK